MSDTSHHAKLKSPAAASRQRPQQQRIGPRPLHAMQASAGNRAASLWFSGASVPLPDAVRVEMESRFGESFSDVRIHDDAQAHASAANLHAKAYTHGHDIVFSANRFAPHTGSGKRLLAHELAHVVQQRRGGPHPALDGGAPHEAAAHRAADSVMSATGPVAVQGGTATGIAREEDKGAAPPLGAKATGIVVDAVLRGLGLPSGRNSLAACAVRGMVEQMFRELASKEWGGKGKAAVLLGHIAAMGPRDYAQLAKGYFAGLLEGVVSPVTDLFGLAVFGEKLNNMAREFAISAFGSKPDLTAEFKAVMQNAKNTKDALGMAWDNMIRDPSATVMTLLSLPGRLNELAEQKAYQLGQQGGSAIIASFEAPWSGKKEEHPTPSPLDSPLGWVESKVKAGESWLLDTPWSQIGAKIGYSVGFVAIQIVLFAFTDGIGNAIEAAGAALGRLAGTLGKLSKALGAAAGRMAELATAIGKGITLVEQAIAQLVGKILKPLEKLLEPVLKPLGSLLMSLRQFLRKLLGVTEKEGAQLLNTTAAKAASAADEALAPKVASAADEALAPKVGSAADEALAPKIVPHETPPQAPSARPTAKPPEPASAGSTHEGDVAKPATKKTAAPADQAPATNAGAPKKTPAATEGVEAPAKPSRRAKSAQADEPSGASATGSGKKQAAAGKQAAARPGAAGKQAAGGKETAKQATPTTRGGKAGPARQQPRINDPHGMRPDAGNFDRQTAGTGGIDEISFLRDPDARFAVKIKGKMKPGLYRGKGKPPAGKTKAPDYNRSTKLIKNRQAGLDANWEDAHLWGPGFGDEAAAGIMKAPRAVNQWYQNEGIEGWARDVRKAADQFPRVGGKAAEVEVEATALAWDMHGSAWQPKAQVDFLKRAEYRVKLTTPQGQKATITVTIDVPRPPAHGAVVSFDPPHAVNPADLLNITKGQP